MQELSQDDLQGSQRLTTPAKIWTLAEFPPSLGLVNVCKCQPDKAGHGHHAQMLPPKNLAVFALVWFEDVVQPPL